MMFRRKRREVPGLNTTSTADISFMLLIFFLVTTSMEVDKGMPRQLPPYEDQQKQEQMDVDRNKVMTVEIRPDRTFSVENPMKGEGTQIASYAFPMNDRDAKDVRRQLKEFIVKTGPEHIIELKVDREAAYDTYFEMQNVIVRSYREIRDAYARQHNGHPYAQLNDDDRQQVLMLYPQRIVEK